MNIPGLTSFKVLEILALDLGLLILLGWFVILWLILREFRKFAHKAGGNGSHVDDKLIAEYQDSIEMALNYSADNRDTLDALIRVQQGLENQLANIKASTSDHISKEEKASMDDLNARLKKAHKLIHKLKGDLDSSVKKLKITREKLYSQYDTVERLTKENKKISEQFEQLEREYVQLTSNPSTTSSSDENNNLKRALQQYKKQMTEQDQVIQQLMAQGADNTDAGEAKKLQQKLLEAEERLTHLVKEKDFVEKKFLDLLQQVEKK
ncbi:chromosome partitioning protein ParA [Pseudoalteromonas sp. MMG024]|uniref:chromosome partitioning protein ParA n=1 Tax=Pseudoalteromonas sp. MMG024 TaxID=2909980 RepID=UPI001F491569|nr:chromosome partitioning protein ParA [Pseudoalteromonas sp. MMG024]MCF6456365.1 chromosome partitioning protein ParA [Pseudoalteromonas sp. MMG024]